MVEATNVACSVGASEDLVITGELIGGCPGEGMIGVYVWPGVGVIVRGGGGGGGDAVRPGVPCVGEGEGEGDGRGEPPHVLSHSGI